MVPIHPAAPGSMLVHRRCFADHCIHVVQRATPHKASMLIQTLQALMSKHPRTSVLGKMYSEPLCMLLLQRLAEVLGSFRAEISTSSTRAISLSGDMPRMQLQSPE